MKSQFVAYFGLGSLVLTGGCVTRVTNETGSAQPAVVSLVDSSQENYDVQPIVLTIDGQTPRKAGVAKPINGMGSMDNEYAAGTVIATPPLRPQGWDFAVTPGTRKIGLVFAVPGNGFLNWAVVTRGRGSEATGVSIDVLAGCQYQIAAKLTVLGGRDYEPMVRFVRPIPAQMGLPAAATCPSARDVPIRLTYD